MSADTATPVRRTFDVRSVLAVVLKACLIAAAYILFARISRGVDTLREDGRVLLPQPGIALAGLVLFGLGYWPVVLAASLLVTLTATPPVQWQLAVGYAFGNTLAAAAGAAILRNRNRFDPSMSRIRDVYVFLAVSVLFAPMISSVIAMTSFIATQWPQTHLAIAAAFPLGLRRWFGHSMGNLIVAPMLLTWGRSFGFPRDEYRYASGWKPSRWTMMRFEELGLLLSLLVAVCIGCFTSRLAIPALNFPVSYAPFPFVIWAALRFGSRGASTSIFIVSTIAIFGTSQSQGPFARYPMDQRLLLLQVYLMVITLTALFLAAAVAERRTAETQLLLSREQLRALSERLQSAREEERAIVAREIHDELGQQLTGIKMGLNMAQRKLPPEADASSRKITELTSLTDEAVKTVRRIAQGLRPGMLDDLGIIASAQWLCEDFTERTGILAVFKSNVDDLKLDSDRSIAAFRIVQEALTNVARHSEADRVEAELTYSPDELTIRVTDNGRGLSHDPLAHPKSLGLVGMRERAELLGGTMIITSKEGEGTGVTVVARIPLV